MLSMTRTRSSVRCSLHVSFFHDDDDVVYEVYVCTSDRKSIENLSSALSQPWESDTDSRVGAYIHGYIFPPDTRTVNSIYMCGVQ